MKRILFIASMILLGFTASQAQHAPPGGRRMGDMAKMRAAMYEGLNLSDSQKVQMNALDEGFRAKMQDIRNNSSLTDEQKRAAVQAARDEQKTKRDAILTAEQREKLDAKMKEMQEMRRNRNSQ